MTEKLERVQTVSSSEGDCREARGSTAAAPAVVDVAQCRGVRQLAHEKIFLSSSQYAAAASHGLRITDSYAACGHSWGESVKNGRRLATEEEVQPFGLNWREEGSLSAAQAEKFSLFLPPLSGLGFAGGSRPRVLSQSAFDRQLRAPQDSALATFGLLLRYLSFA